MTPEQRVIAEDWVTAYQKYLAHSPTIGSGSRVLLGLCPGWGD